MVKAYQSLGIPVTLRLVEQDESLILALTGNQFTMVIVPRGTTLRLSHKLMQSYWRNLGGEGLLSIGQRSWHQRFGCHASMCLCQLCKTAAYEEPLGFLYASKAAHQDEHSLIRGTTYHIEYVMVLASLPYFKYLDHSKNFHNLVAQFLPDWSCL